MSGPSFHFVTLFPTPIETWLNTSIMGRAHQRKLFDYTTHQLRDFSKNKHRSVDDLAYGGGGGMVLKIEPLVLAVETIKEKLAPKSAEVICFTPQGDKINQHLIDDLIKMPTMHYILICGHYEGIDHRFIEGWVDLQISLGDFVVTGGELPALALVDAWVRQLEGALGNKSAAQKESFKFQDTSGFPLLEHAHYTRPPEFRGKEVPQVLLSGDHEKITKWRLDSSTQLTQCLRPDLLQGSTTLTKQNKTQ